MNKDTLYDIIIIGGGPAGLSCGIYAGRSNLKTLIIEKSGEGSLLKAHLIDNYPGFPQGIKGLELYNLMKEQTIKYNVEFQEATVLNFDFDKIVKTVKTSVGNFMGKFVVVASGIATGSKKLKGEKEFIGNGVSYCATCDGAFTKNMNVVLFGQGEEVAEEALFLTKFSKEITIFVPDGKLLCPEKTLEAIHSSNIKVIINAEIKEITGKDYVEKVLVEIKDNQNILTKEFAADFVFLYLGTKSNKELYGEHFKLDDKGFIITDESMKTNLNNVYAVGDVRAKEVRQVSTAVSDGTIAALSILKEQLTNKSL
ncbi:NAD(P)/FAD-dependent oxidoreductase [Fusobacterium sp. PH5-44]|uniref:NAD(P)/FAD-dependent oxidoreductase n=1 Tax=unclassified Fusobacterium TaxID=2648384 RepID=UPI003D1E5AE0